jgi:autotransporter passenger strand-loop-strand repeat protein
LAQGDTINGSGSETVFVGGIATSTMLEGGFPAVLCGGILLRRGWCVTI